MTFLGFLLFVFSAAVLYAGITDKKLGDEARRILGGNR